MQKKVINQCILSKADSYQLTKHILIIRIRQSLVKSCKTLLKSQTDFSMLDLDQNLRSPLTKKVRQGNHMKILKFQN